MSNLLSAFFVTISALAIAPAASAAPSWGNGNNNICNDNKGNGNNGNGHDKDDDKDCKGNNHKKNCKHNGGKNDDPCGGKNDSKLECDAGGPYVAAATGTFSSVQLDGRDSRDETGYAWSTNLPGAIFDNPTSGTPLLTFPSGPCSFDFVVTLTVTGGNKSKSCQAEVRVRDCQPPVITCPEDAKLFCGEDSTPGALGFATATDTCDGNVTITYKDTIEQGTCPAERFDYVIRRRWKARDDAGNFSTCTQTIDIVKQLALLDVRPGNCPNAYDRNACDLLPVAIVGLESFPVNQIQWGSIKMYGLHCDGGPVAPQCTQYADVTGPYYPTAECECDVVGPDGILDLVAYFKRSKLNQLLGLGNAAPGSTISVVITGRLCGGCEFVATDCLLVL